MSRFVALVSATLIATLMGCAENQRKAESPKEEPKVEKKAEKKSWSAASCTGIDHLSEFDGMAAAQLEEALGQPRKKESFLRGERKEEFHILLEKIYPLSKEGNAKVPLQEWTWTEGKCQLTVWLHKPKDAWTAFENSRYSAT